MYTRYFIATGLSELDDGYNLQMNAIAQPLMHGKASKWLDHLERLGTAPTTLTDLSTKLLAQFSVLDDEKTAQISYGQRSSVVQSYCI